MELDPHAPRRRPLAATEPLVARVTADAITAWVDGNRQAAIERLLDARAIAGAHPDWAPFEAFLAAAVFRQAVDDADRLKPVVGAAAELVK